MMMYKRCIIGYIFSLYLYLRTVDEMHMAQVQFQCSTAGTEIHFSSPYNSSIQSKCYTSLHIQYFEKALKSLNLLAFGLFKLTVVSYSMWMRAIYKVL